MPSWVIVKNLTFYLIQTKLFFLSHFQSSHSLCRLQVLSLRFVVLQLLNLSGHLGTRVSLPGCLGTLSFTLRLRAAGPYLAVEEWAPGAFNLGGLALHGLQGAQPEESAVVVALMVSLELFEDVRGANLR